MAQNLGELVTKYTERLDAIVLAETCTSDLNMNQDLVGEMTGNGTIEVASIAMDGLADHTRGGGFTRGGVELKWEPYTLKYERDREFSIDVLDDEERAKIVSANVMGEFARTKVVPELDAVRFAKLAANAGNKVEETLDAADATYDSVLKAEEAMQDVGKSLSECILFHTAHVKTLLRKSQEYRFGNGENPNGNFQTFDDMKLVNVPSDRFYTAVELLDGKTSGEEGGGYKKADGAQGINFIVMAPEAAAAIVKHEKLRYFDPETNQNDEAHLWQYRVYHDLLVYLQKKGLIYASIAKATA